MSRLAIVTGAAQGIGLEIARLLGAADTGFSVLLTARDGVRGAAAAAELRQAGARVSFHALDITNRVSIEALVRHVEHYHGGRVHALVNNAGIAFKGDVWGAAEAEATMACNLLGTIAVTDALRHCLRAAATPAEPARIINVCSQMGRLAQVSPRLQAAFQSVTCAADVAALASEFVAAVADGTYAEKGWPRSMYGVSKLAELAWSFALAKQVLADNIEVQAVCPGAYARASLRCVAVSGTMGSRGGGVGIEGRVVGRRGRSELHMRVPPTDVARASRRPEPPPLAPSPAPPRRLVPHEAGRLQRAARRREGRGDARVARAWRERWDRRAAAADRRLLARQALDCVVTHSID